MKPKDAVKNGRRMFLCNQAVRRMVLPVARKASHRLIFTALDEGVVLDQIYLYTPRIK